ncbi:3-deoxy-manno-octulosonate cytidylyltransferase [Salinisphaera aquimarina]|uniref:3-deoxy-manno-octulosonate cytidylyltransferase n=1 Tax=Salinisphaera aquimarina TaxID=2094031 RepID=A0ABV7ERK3_9GAMM
MSFIVVIPARLASTRLPNKVLRELAGEPMLAHVCRAALASRAERVIVATDSTAIADAGQIAGAEVAMTRSDHSCGSDRIAEVVTTLALRDDQIVVNVQADEPLMPVVLIDQVGQALMDDPGAGMASARTPIVDAADFVNPNIVKVVSSASGRALYFSRAPIPFHRASGNQEVMGLGYRHLGIYAYRVAALKRFSAAPVSALEQHESLEQLRAFDLELGIAMVTAAQLPGPGVDTEADLIAVARLLEGPGSA